MVFLDDILVSGKTDFEHLNNLEMVLNKLEGAGLKLSVDKCDFFQDEIKYLGFRID